MGSVGSVGSVGERFLPHPPTPPTPPNTARLRILNWNLVWGKGEPARSWGFPP